MATNVRIILESCDGTNDFKMRVTDAQLKFLNTLSDKFGEGGGGCTPDMSITCGGTWTKRQIVRGTLHTYELPCMYPPKHDGECKGW